MDRAQSITDLSANAHCSVREGAPREPVCGGRTPVLATGFIYLSGQICRKLIFKIMVNKANTSKAERIFQKVPDLKDCPDRRGVQVVSRVSLECAERVAPPGA